MIPIENFIEYSHPDWHPILFEAISCMDPSYLTYILHSDNWLPKREWIFRAFTKPLSSTRYVLLGESPYPRPESANGYAFWDASVNSIWETTGLSRAVNKATSLRHLIKMLLRARGDLQQDVSQHAIAKLGKSNYVNTLNELFNNMLNQGFLLLNASLVYEVDKVPYHAKHWRVFMDSIFSQLSDSLASNHSSKKSSIEMILLGKIASRVNTFSLPIGLLAEHPYNVSFVNNHAVLDFFKPLDLLSAL